MVSSLSSGFTDSPAEQLQGKLLTNGWRVVSRLSSSGEMTGGTFSASYIVENEKGERGFLKALDYSRALKSNDPARSLQALTAAYNIERDLLQLCANKRLSRVIRAIDSGKIDIDRTRADGVVEYLIFELADHDIRGYLDWAKSFDLAWTLRTLHQIATGLFQLHRIDVAHQDLKPSNILVFAKDISKIADLGRATQKQVTAPYDNDIVSGDPTYAPPEQLYGYADADWIRRRLGCDLYHLGSMIVFFFSAASMTAMIKSYLASAHDWDSWGGTYSEVLPYVQDAFSKASYIIGSYIPASVRAEIIKIVGELCNPDPGKRGVSKRLGHYDQYSLERYISRLDFLAKRAELGIFDGSVSG